MARGTSVLTLASALVCAAFGAAALVAAVVSQEAPPSQENPLTEDEIRALADRAIANQHRDDMASKECERVEHQVMRSTATDGRTLEDKTFRVVPTGTGTLRLLVKLDGRAVDANTYRRQLLDWQQVLQIGSNPNDQRVKTALAKSAKREQDRKDLVDAARQAFRAKWLGRETRDGRVYEILQLEPNSGFQPHNLAQDLLMHVRAKAWIDQQSGQLARGEAEIIRDISFGGGLFGKVYRGGHFAIEQSEVAPGIWQPTRYQYDYMGRKFLFTFETHEYTELGHYRHIGTPSEALQVVRSELHSGQTFMSDP
jgi:hypothetical protein